MEPVFKNRNRAKRILLIELLKRKQSIFFSLRYIGLDWFKSAFRTHLRNGIVFSSSFTGVEDCMIGFSGIGVIGLVNESRVVMFWWGTLPLDVVRKRISLFFSFFSFELMGELSSQHFSHRTIWRWTFSVLGSSIFYELSSLVNGATNLLMGDCKWARPSDTKGNK